MVKQILATRDMTANINGIEYEILLIPKEKIVDIDYTNAPELHPKNKRKDIKKDDE